MTISRLSNIPETLNVLFERDSESNSWTATVVEDSRVVTQGKTLQQAYIRVRQALSLVREDSATVRLVGRVEVTNDPRLGPDVRRLVQEEGELRVRLLSLQDELEVKTWSAVEALVTQHKLTFRAAGQLLGISHQRVEQIHSLRNED